MNNVFLSNRLDLLVERLCQQFEDEPISPMANRTILVPNRFVGDWLLLEIAKKRGIAICLKIIEPQVLFQSQISSTELFCSIYAEIRESQDSELIAYLEGKEKRQIGLAKELTSLFQKYSLYDKALIESKESGFQKEILRKIFPSKKKLALIQQEVQLDEPVYCFGIDYLPPIYWNSLFSSPHLSIYLFSPCMFFWEDVASDWERKSFNRYWKKQGKDEESRASLDDFLKEAPRNLANWGKLGRETLKTLDAYDLQTEELHTEIQPNTLLKQIQYDLLHFEHTKNPKIDDSIKVLLTGSSKLREIEILRDEILSLSFDSSEIAVFSPDIEPYVPLIEYVFKDQIPYRISGFDITPQSSFRQGLIRLLSTLKGRWDSEAILTLFETPSFYRKLGWKTDTLLVIRSWIEFAHIQWGLNPDHRKNELKKTFGERNFEDYGSWEKGLDTLLETLIYEKEIEVEADLFETLISVIDDLKTLRTSEKKTLAEWSEYLERIAFKFLIIDPNGEADQIAANGFHSFLKDLKESEDGRVFSVEVIEHLLVRPHFGQIHASKLHAVRFSPLHFGVIPAKAIFLLGMDEASFPSKPTLSSLDLLKNMPDQSDRDRYLFLSAIFSSTEVLRISFSHLSDEGKPVGPSLLVQDLLNVTGVGIQKECPIPPLKFSQKHLSWPKRNEYSKLTGQVTLNISDLKKLARHPWDFYLQKVHEIYLDKTLEETFALEKAKLMRSSSCECPPGMIGKALMLDVLEKKEEFDELIKSWQVQPFTLELREGAPLNELTDDRFVTSAIEFQIDDLCVKIVGVIPGATEKGILFSGQDSVAGALKIWPEALVAAICLKAPNILMLKNGKTKTFHDPEKHLEAFIRYYFECLAAPSPLINDWTDAFLRKGPEALEKAKIKGTTFKDPVFDWVIARAELPTAEEMFLDWGPIFKNTFSELAALYPTRGAK